ncbi:MAG: DUF3306 domain-containing protein [Rhodobacterales bacterium]|nr:DUF3306 domain-containing protein [Rhodobacterales bacterium]
MSADREGRLARWARLKTESRVPGAADQAMPAQVFPDEPRADTMLAVAVVPADLDAGPDAEAAAVVADLPDVETLDAASDYTPFLNDKVPAHLARAALRKLWRSDPVLANLDGLNDYDEDFSVVQTISAALDTSYRVGRGQVGPEPEPEDGEPDGGESAPETGSHAPERLARGAEATPADGESPVAPEDDGDGEAATA